MRSPAHPSQSSHSQPSKQPHARLHGVNPNSLPSPPNPHGTCPCTVPTCTCTCPCNMHPLSVRLAIEGLESGHRPWLQRLKLRRPRRCWSSLRHPRPHQPCLQCLRLRCALPALPPTLRRSCVSRLSSPICRLPSAVSHLQSPISHLPSPVSHHLPFPIPPSLISRLPSLISSTEVPDCLSSSPTSGLDCHDPPPLTSATTSEDSRKLLPPTPPHCLPPSPISRLPSPVSRLPSPVSHQISRLPPNLPSPITVSSSAPPTPHLDHRSLSLSQHQLLTSRPSLITTSLATTYEGSRSLCHTV